MDSDSDGVLILIFCYGFLIGWILIGWTLVAFWIQICWTLDFGFGLVGLGWRYSGGVVGGVWSLWVCYWWWVV